VASITTVQQGGATHLRVTNARAGSAMLLGRTFPLSAEGDALVGYVAVGADDPVGPTSLAVAFTDVAGVQRNATVPLTVIKTAWTVDYIVLPPPPPPDPNAPPPPPPPPDETPRLQALYRTISPRRWQPGWQAPVDSPFGVTGYFGEQRSFNGGPVQGHHGGTDFGSQHGDPIYATNDGVVVMAELTLFRGNLVVVDHGAGVLSSYGHMSQLAVQVGETVTRGALLGYVGATGLATGPHLHWEMAVGGVLVDGLRWLDGSQGF
jgi:murein DD-endopeptidase MepM/ murein hydrolase activator NlpD